MVRHLARDDIEFSGFHTSAGRRAVRVPDCLWRTATGHWTRFSLAPVPSVRNPPSTISVPFDSWMSGYLPDSQFRALQRSSCDNNSPRSDGMDDFHRSCDLVVEDKMNAMCLAHAFRLSYRLAIQAHQELYPLPFASEYNQSIVRRKEPDVASHSPHGTGNHGRFSSGSEVSAEFRGA